MVRKKIFVQPNKQKKIMLVFLSVSQGILTDAKNLGLFPDANVGDVKVVLPEKLRYELNHHVSNHYGERIIISGIFSDENEVVYGLTDVLPYIPINDKVTVVVAITPDIAEFFRNPYNLGNLNSAAAFRPVVPSETFKMNEVPTVAKYFHGQRHHWAKLAETSNGWDQITQEEQEIVIAL